MTGRALHARVPWPGRETAEVPRERPAPRQLVTWTCQRGHVFRTVFAAGIELPDAWPCPCGAAAGQAPPLAEPSYHEHCMTLVRMRRTDTELEVILAEAIAELHR